MNPTNVPQEISQGNGTAKKSLFTRQFNIGLSLILGIGLLGAMLIIQPKRYGDGEEYFLMTESFLNHLTPDLQDQDSQAHEDLKTKFKMHDDGILWGYFKAKDNKLYSCHFWSYSLFCLPVKFILHTFKLNELKALQITNALLIFFILFQINFKFQLAELQKTIFILLIVFSPALWFVHWPTPEIFSYSFVILSIIYMHRKKWRVSIICAAIASLQNQPLIFLAFFLWVKGILYSKNKREYLILSIAASLALIHNIFSYIKFGVPSFLGTIVARPENTSLVRLWDMFFDLNIGMFPYTPLILFTFLGIVFYGIVVKRKFELSQQLFLVILIMMLSATSTTNFNHGTMGPTRYIIWMLPLIYYILILQIDAGYILPSYRSTYLKVIFSAIGIQFLTTFALLLGSSHVEHFPIAKFMLNNFPALYNPNAEVFAERTLHKEYLRGKPDETPVIYYHDRACRKALVRVEDEERLTQLCGPIPESGRKVFADPDNKGKLVYINF